MNTLNLPLIAGLAATLVLAGCGNKPPGCADTETVSTIRSILVSNAAQVAPTLIRDDAGLKDDPNGIQERYLQGLKVELSNVVTDGYNDQAKRYACRAALTLTTVAGETLKRDIAYATQSTEDKNSKFVVEVGAFQQTVMAVATDLTVHYFAKRYVGEWPGEYRCDGIDDAKDGPQGPFSMPVAMVVGHEGLDGAKLERTTKGGGIEVIQGQAGHNMKLFGKGQNTPDDTWRVQFEGKVQGMDFAAEGQIFTEDKRLLRSCTLKLKLPKND